MPFASLLAMADGAALDILGGPVYYAPSVGAALRVNAIFDAEFRRSEPGEPGVASAGPALFVRLSDLPLDPALDQPRIVVGEETYRVREVQKDGAGGAVLHLHRVVD